MKLTPICRDTIRKLGLAGAIIVAPALAFAAFTPGEVVPTALDELEAMLTAQGYSVEEIELEDGEIEIEYVADGIEYELTIARDTGEILEVEAEKADDDDDDEDDDD